MLENLICLCRKHHNAAHHGFLTRGRLREMLRQFWKYDYPPEQFEEK